MANIGILVLLFLTILIVMGLSLITILIVNGTKERGDFDTFKSGSFIDSDPN